MPPHLDVEHEVEPQHRQQEAGTDEHDPLHAISLSATRLRRSRLWHTHSRSQSHVLGDPGHETVTAVASNGDGVQIRPGPVMLVIVRSADVFESLMSVRWRMQVPLLSVVQLAVSVDPPGLSDQVAVINAPETELEDASSMTTVALAIHLFPLFDDGGAAVTPAGWIDSVGSDVVGPDGAVVVVDAPG